MLSVLDYKASDLEILKDQFQYQEMMRSKVSPVYVFRENEKIVGFSSLLLEKDQVILKEFKLAEEISKGDALFFIKVICVKAMDFGYEQLVNKTHENPFFKYDEEIIFQEFLKSCSHD